MGLVRRITWFIIWGTVAGVSAAQEQHFMLSVIGGVLNGQAEEIVYKTETSNIKLSQLLWEMKPLTYGGIKLGYSFTPQVRKFGFFSSFVLKSGVQGKTGVMEDRDWLSEAYPNWLTHYSVHDNSTKNALLIDADAGTHYRLTPSLLLKMSLSFSYMNFLWSAAGGSFLYPEVQLDNYGNPIGSHGYIPASASEVIRYEQVWMIVTPVIALWGAFNNKFDIELTFKISPFVYFNDKDEHLMRNLVITSAVQGGFFIEPSLLFSFKPRDFLSLSLSVAYRNINRVRGDAVYTEDDKPTRYKNISGAAYTALDASLAVTYRLF